MPSVAAPATILVTGVSGYVASHVAHAYLQRGFTVRGTVRSPAKGGYLRSLFEKDYPGKFEYVIADVEKLEDMEAAARGVGGIAHVASPSVLPPGADPQELIRPAVNGTLNVLESAARAGTVQRVVITGSVVSFLQPHDAPYTYTARDWNDHAVQRVEQLGRQASTMEKYEASKVLAERAAYAWMAEHNPGFDISHILPYYVFGPTLTEVSALEQVPPIPRLLFDIFAHPKSRSDLTIGQGGFVHVYDVARAHVDAHTREELGGSARLILSSKSDVPFQDYYDAYWSLPESEHPRLPFEVTRGEPRAGDAVRDRMLRYDNAEDILGWSFTPLDVVIRDTLGDISRKVFGEEKESP